MEQLSMFGLYSILDSANDEETIYQGVLKALPTWTPTRKQRSFNISAIQEIIPTRYLVARSVLNRLESEGYLIRLEELNEHMQTMQS